MAKLIIIRGQKNSGKSTTVGMVYEKLLETCNKQHIFNDLIKTANSLIYNKIGETTDFKAELEHKTKIIMILSASDIVPDVRANLKIFIEKKADIIICCARSINRKGSTYRMIIDEFESNNHIALEILTNYSDNVNEKFTIKSKIVETIVEKVHYLISN